MFSFLCLRGVDHILSSHASQEVLAFAFKLRTWPPSHVGGKRGSASDDVLRQGAEGIPSVLFGVDVQIFSAGGEETLMAEVAG